MRIRDARPSASPGGTVPPCVGPSAMGGGAAVASGEGLSAMKLSRVMPPSASSAGALRMGWPAGPGIPHRTL